MKTSYKTKTICSSSFKWIDNKGTANGSELIMLGKQHMEKHDGIFVKSIRTGAEKYFEPVHDEDGYDGEFMIYRCGQLFIQIWNY
jgi:hypothetical protein